MRHRFHSICPYFAMFPETFVEKHLAASPHQGRCLRPPLRVRDDGFPGALAGSGCGRERCEPVAACIGGAICDPPGPSEVEARVAELRNGFRVTEEGGWNGGFADFLMKRTSGNRGRRTLRSRLERHAGGVSGSVAVGTMHLAKGLEYRRRRGRGA